VHKIDDPSRVVTPAAYLLFYRRRSSSPLGPQYLRELVQNARTQPDQQQHDRSTAASSDDDELAGEGSLGGPQHSSRLLGSSRDGARAGAGAAASASSLGEAVASRRLRLDDAGSDEEEEGIVRSRSARERRRRSDDDEEGSAGVGFRGPVGTWGFEAIDGAAAGDRVDSGSTLNNTPSEREDAASDRVDAGSYANDDDDDYRRRLLEDQSDVMEIGPLHSRHDDEPHDANLFGPPEDDEDLYEDAPVEEIRVEDKDEV